MERICPNCKIQLGSNDRYFCTSCGSALPKELINTKDVFKRIANFDSISNSSKKSADVLKTQIDVKWPVSRDTKVRKTHKEFKLTSFIEPKAFSASVISLILIALAFLYFKGPIVKFISSYNEKQPNGIQVENNVYENTLGWKKGTFASDKLFEAVPYDAEIVIEGFDLKEFGDFYKTFDSAYTELAGFVENRAYGHFIFFAQNINGEHVWSLIVIPVDKTFVLPDQILSNYPWLKLWKSEPLVVFTTNAQVLDLINNAKSNVAKNFTHTTLFASTKPAVPNELALIIYVKDTNARDYLQSMLLLDNLSLDAKAVIEQAVSAKSGFTVVQ